MSTTFFGVIVLLLTTLSNSLAMLLLDSLTPNSTALHLTISETFRPQTLPSELGSFTQLSSIKIECEKDGCIVGSIPTEIGQLKNLHTFELLSSNVNGSIPLEVANLNLQHFVVPFAGLSGTLPNDFGPNLVTFNVAGNWLSGTLPELSSRSLKRFEVWGNFWLDGSSLPSYDAQKERLDGEYPVIILFRKGGYSKLKGSWADEPFPLYLCTRANRAGCIEHEGVYFRSLPIALAGNLCSYMDECAQSLPYSVLTQEETIFCIGNFCCAKNTSPVWCTECHHDDGSCSQTLLDREFYGFYALIVSGFAVSIYSLSDAIVTLLGVACYSCLNVGPSFQLPFSNVVRDLKFYWFLFITVPVLAVYFYIIQESAKECHLPAKEQTFCLPGLCNCDELHYLDVLIGAYVTILITRTLYLFLIMPILGKDQMFVTALAGMGSTRKLKNLLECYPNYFRMQGTLQGPRRTIMMFLHRNPIVLLLVTITNANGWLQKALNMLDSPLRAACNFSSGKLPWFIELFVGLFIMLVLLVTFLLPTIVYMAFSGLTYALVGEIWQEKQAPNFWLPYWQCKFSPYWCGNTAVQSIAIFGLHDCLKVAIDAGLPRSVNEEVYLAIHQTYMPKQVIKLLIKDQPDFDPNWRPNSWWDYLSSKSILEVVTERGKEDLIAAINGEDDDDDTGAGEVGNTLDEKVESASDEVEDGEMNSEDGGDPLISSV